MIVIYTEEVTARVRYIFTLIFKEFMNSETAFTDNLEQFKASSQVKVNYSDNPVPGVALWVIPQGLLFQPGVKEMNLEFVDYRGHTCPFKLNINKCDFPFDVFSAAFFLISRYEEYLPYKKDAHGRFPAHQSIAFQKGFLEYPLIDMWAMEMREIILSRNNAITLSAPHYDFIPTIDVDVAYAYRLRGVLRTTGGVVNALLSRKIHLIVQRFNVLAGREKDPYDTFDYIIRLHKAHDLRPVFFILFADYNVNDKNISVLNQKFQHLIKALGDHAYIGIHPSYNSFRFPEKIGQEVERLAKTINREIKKSRQHFLRMALPSTCDYLEEVGITEDYTMGYARHTGFRASTSRPFYFYNLEKETPSPLKIVPFAVMDGTLKDYMQLSPQQAEEKVKALAQRVKEVNGVFVSLWHNHSLGEHEEWKGWRKVYEALVEHAAPKNKTSGINL